MAKKTPRSRSVRYPIPKPTSAATAVPERIERVMGASKSLSSTMLE